MVAAIDVECSGTDEHISIESKSEDAGVTGEKRHPQSHDISFQQVSPVDVCIQQLTVQFTPERTKWRKALKILGGGPRPDATRANTSKTLLDGASADMPAGSLTAIVGGSGSGKTTLLNTISHRVSGEKLKISGTVTFNKNPDLRTIRSSYVMQQDVLIPVLTVRETLQYAADLRLPPPSTKEERKAAVERVIIDLGLKDCANTRIGNNIHRGCSGGEKRRTSVGVQLLANPSVLFCDEPTTGECTIRASCHKTLADQLQASMHTVPFKLYKR